ncbi:MAG: pyridoxamine kinase [Lachnospiraceae bacterium]|nr:pyridoxamine kinase [Lachnospiraceae bacterium]
MSHNNQKKIAVINDISGFGRCSITVALPIISHLGIQCCPIPTSIFSNHTAYPQYFFDDYTDKMQTYIDMWGKLGLKFDGIYTGFLGSEKQIEIVKQFIHEFKKDNALVIVDPIMADNGVRYETYTDAMCNEMRQLVNCADIITPNLTEAMILVDKPYNENITNKELMQVGKSLIDMGPKKVVITGVKRGSYLVNYIYQKNQELKCCKTKRVGEERAGTGDVFSSIIAADAVNGKDIYASVKKASDFIKKAVIKTNALDIPLEDGIAFEEHLKYLR